MSGYNVSSDRALTGEDCLRAIRLLIGAPVAVRIRSGHCLAEMTGTLREVTGGYSVTVIHGASHGVALFPADDIETMVHEKRPERWLILLKHTTA